ncbi:MAG: hypothetical protein M0042_15050 [Nitrospiraceae bacterium]|nr:hypothetical protein [Nitrospiraceae bacterium]
MPAKKVGTAGAKQRQRLVKKHGVTTSENDNLSKGMSSLVPKDYRDSGRFIDSVQWNLEWFGAAKSREKDKRRFDLVVDILATLNSDLFVLQEVAGPSEDGRYPGIMDSVAEELTRRVAGDYRVAYTNTGGEQRVAMMWDSDWLRSKSEVAELFERGHYAGNKKKDPFAGRTPLLGYFSLRIPSGKKQEPGADRFDFQNLGVHLKAMEEGAAQRLESAGILADWLKNKAPLTDNDVMIMGDWNVPPDAACWKPFHDMERADTNVHFTDINDQSDFSYLWHANRDQKFVSRIDLTVMSLSSETEYKMAGRVVRWKPIQDAIKESKNITDKKVKDVMKELKDTISDHMPTISRFSIAK